MIISVEFKNGIAEVEVVSGMKDSELKELPHFAQALLSTKVISDDITKRFELLKAFTEDVLGKDDTEDIGYITDNNKNALKVEKSKNISTNNKKVPMAHTLEKLYKEYENEKLRYNKCSQMLSILKDIRADEYISDNDRALIDAKIKVYEGKISGLKAAYEKLMKAISEV